MYFWNSRNFNANAHLLIVRVDSVSDVRKLENVLTHFDHFQFKANTVVRKSNCQFTVENSRKFGLVLEVTMRCRDLAPNTLFPYHRAFHHHYRYNTV